MNGESAEKATIFAIALNIFLFIIKLAAGLLSGSLAVLSDAFNSFLDIFSYIITYASVRLSNKGPDSDHPFGHRRAEPLAAILVAMFAGILAFEIQGPAVIEFQSLGGIRQPHRGRHEVGDEGRHKQHGANEE